MKLSLELWVETLPNDSDWVAFMYGPIVLVGALGTADMPDVLLNDPHSRAAEINYLPTPPVPSLTGSPETLLTTIEPIVDKPLNFILHDVGFLGDVELVPFYRLHRQRYTVYWNLK